MEDIFEQQHYEFINSEDYFQFIKEMFEYEEKNAFFSEKEIYVHEKLAKKNLESWIEWYGWSLAENQRRVEVLPQHNKEWLPKVEEYKAGLEVLNSCKIVKVKISFEVVA